MNTEFEYKGHKAQIQIENGFAYIRVDGKTQFRVKHPNSYSLENYAKEFIDRKYNDQ
jgi:hypothetical protein